ncbi:hypothetical protein B0J11DRAFT_428251 [Dendryphion nanum]|uniref:CCR4-NOT transcription complex subunit 11 n=1 Tax=Dendryphion nanum TaxID=256645 RepID=A0A9P9IVL3_9PLEO|nr:hypothetical protein B0J11DRAFT_428251 [Dendryphion nanum]
MDISATLTADEVASMSYPERSLNESARLFQLAVKSELQTRDESHFEQSLRLKNTLDLFEQKAKVEPTWPQLAVLLNCEHQLYILNERTPLRLNPFLSHWVEAIQRLVTTQSKLSAQPSTTASRTESSLCNADIELTRLELIKSLLQGHDRQRLGASSPRQLYQKSVEERYATPFEIRPYICMLEEEGIYDKPSADPGSEDFVASQLEQIDTSMVGNMKPGNRQDWKQVFLTRLAHEPESAVSDLTRLPLELTSLDFLTNLLQNQTLQLQSIEPSPVIHDFLQHSLRLIEQMGQPMEANIADSFAMGSRGGFDGADDEIDHGRDAQTRAVKLLLLFIRNLVRKALVPLDAIYFEIQEICVRYVWIKEVRQFRAFLEEGTTNEQTL